MNQKEGSFVTVDHVLPDGRWKFDNEVTDVFDNMLRRSIPQYEVMREGVFSIGKRFVRPGTAIIDLGCSRGEALAPLVAKFGSANHFVGVEISEPMLSAARQRFVREIDFGFLEIKKMDLRSVYPVTREASLTMAILSVLFIPIEYRQTVLRNVYKSLSAGGAFILVEKILGADAELSDMFIDLYLDMKRMNGYSEEEIQRKKLALEGVQVPVTAAWNEQMLKAAGFARVDCFWRWMNFAGWIAVKS